MPIGAGGAPAGTSAAGYGVPDSGTVNINVPLPSPITGASLTGRLIDPVTKDYVYTADGRAQGQATVPQLVLLALSTVLGSSAIPTLGQTFSQIQEKGPNFKAQLTSAVQNALAAVIKAKQVQLLSVDVQEPPSNPDAGIAIVKWKDLTTGVVQTSAIGP